MKSVKYVQNNPQFVCLFACLDSCSRRQVDRGGNSASAVKSTRWSAVRWLAAWVRIRVLIRRPCGSCQRRLGLEHGEIEMKTLGVFAHAILWRTAYFVGGDHWFRYCGDLRLLPVFERKIDPGRAPCIFCLVGATLFWCTRELLQSPAVWRTSRGKWVLSKRFFGTRIILVYPNYTLIN